MLSLFGFISLSTANCFGKFALVRKVYEIHDNIKLGGSKKIDRVIQSLPFYLFGIAGFVYGISGLVDFIVFNLLEFWTDSNPLGLNEYDENGRYAKTFEQNGEKFQFVYSNYGQRLDLTFVKSGNSETLVFFKNQTDKIFKEVNGELQEVNTESHELGDKTLIQMVVGGKLKSEKLVETNSLNDLKTTYSGYSL